MISIQIARATYGVCEFCLCVHFAIIPSMTNKRIAIFVDGGNLYHIALKKIGVTELDFDFDNFVDFLANGRTIEREYKRYYVGTVRERDGDPRSKYLMSRQTKLFASLKKHQWKLRTSKLKVRTETVAVDERMVEYQKILDLGITEISYERRREKGVDVMIATDLIVGAVENRYDTALVISSDADLLPAIQWVRQNGKLQVEYVGFSIDDENIPGNSIRPLYSMFSNSDSQRVITGNTLRMFINDNANSR